MTASFSDDEPPVKDTLKLRRRAMLLHHLRDVPQRGLRKGDANKRISAAAAKELGLTTAVANQAREELVDSGEIHSEKVGRTTLYVLTDAGKSLLQNLSEYLPPPRCNPPRGKVNLAENGKVKREREVYLLLQLLKVTGYAISGATANTFNDGYARDGLELNAATAWHIRGDLATRGLINITLRGRSEIYKLTNDGLLFLGNAAFPAERTFHLPGAALNALVEAARSVAKQFGEIEPASIAPPQPAQLELAIIAALEELLRERHAQTGMVPIHEIREQIRREFGEVAARHELFDESLHRLRRGDEVILSPITDLSRASHEQLQASIPGLGETLFYAERGHVFAKK